jgi:hypothetical protein
VQSGNEQVGQHAREPRPWAEEHHVRAEHGVDRLLARPRRGARRPHGVQGDALHLPWGAGDGHLPANAAHGTVLVQPGHLGLDLQRLGRHGQHAAGHADQPAGLVERGNRVPEHLEQPRQEQVANGVPGERAVAAEAVLEHLRPQGAPVTLLGDRQRGQGLAQVTGR